MPTKIDKLTDAQMARIPEWTQKWIAIGLDTSEADFDRAEAAVLACYKLVKADPPKKILRVDSPWAAIHQGAIANIELQVEKEKEKKKPAKAGFDARVKKFVKDNWYNYRGCQLWASWFSYVTFFRDVCDWENPSLENFKYDEELALSCGFVWWSDDVVAISNRYQQVKRDNAGRLHNDEGMAIEWRDGWGIYSWHGYRLPPTHHWLIKDKHLITADRVEHETNAELRRIMLEIYGYDKYLAERKARVISEDTDVNGHPRRLLEFSLAGDSVRVIEVVNGSLEPDGSRRKFILGCVRQNDDRGRLRFPDTPAEAVAWSFGIAAPKFKETVRT